MVHVQAEAGICGFTTRITVASIDKQRVRLDIDSQCPNLKPLKEELQSVDGFAEVFANVGESPLYEIVKKHCKHAACPVPVAIIKGIEVECGLALPKEVKITIVKEPERSRPEL